MSLLVFIDETGDHSLELVDKGFPLFALVMLICDRTHYAQKIVPSVNQLKTDYFGHEGVILHSRDIRKGQSDFGFLTDPQRRPPFYERINRIMSESEYMLIASVIRKQEHKEKYAQAVNPYDLALKFGMERLLPLLEDAGQREVHLLAEARGKREDSELKLAFYKIITEGTEYLPAERFKRIEFHLEFKPKTLNIIGTQMADLAAYPIARHVLDSKKANRAFEILEAKFYKGRGMIRGLKIFP